jgi:signal transduction histidine kinase
MVSTQGSRTSFLPPWLGRVLLVASCLTVVQGAYAAAPRSEPGHLAAWVGAALYVVAFLASYEWPLRILFLLASAGTILLSFTVAGNASFVAAVATMALSGLRLPEREGRAIAAITAAGFLAGVAVTSHAAVRDIVAPGAGLLFTYIAVHSLRRLRQEQQRTRELLEEVIAGRDDRIRAAALEERARLAREIHDILAHTLSALNIQLEGARMLAEQRPDDPALLERLDRAGRLTREGMDEAKRAVGSLRGDAPPGPDLLPALAEGFQRDTGIPTTLDVRGAVRDLPPDARLALYRVAQEALTNVRKHTAATSVRLTLCYGDGGVELTVEDEGVARVQSAPGGGFGLSGMRERAELLGARLEAGPVEGGFRVCLWIPS